MNKGPKSPPPAPPPVTTTSAEALSVDAEERRRKLRRQSYADTILTTPQLPNSGAANKTTLG